MKSQNNQDPSKLWSFSSQETSDVVSSVFWETTNFPFQFLQSQMMTLKIASYPSVHSAGM